MVAEKKIDFVIPFVTAPSGDILRDSEIHGINNLNVDDDDDEDDDEENESGIFSKENRIEVLNISHKEERCGYRLQFDDPRWRKYTSNLKPLGLHILVNICNEDVISKHSEFSAHLNCVTHQQIEELAGGRGVDENFSKCDIPSYIYFLKNK